jgi:tRNA(fMet)-specific endonuclease VapC
MILYVLDTDMLTLLQHGHPTVMARCLARAQELATTVISAEEQVAGRFIMIRRAQRPDDQAIAYQRLVDTLGFLGRMPILTFPEAAIVRFQQLKAMKLNIGGMDLRIAATVLELGLTLVTRNRRDFGRVPGLLLEDWST